MRDWLSSTKYKIIPKNTLSRYFLKVGGTPYSLLRYSFGVVGQYKTFIFLPLLTMRRGFNGFLEFEEEEKEREKDVPHLTL
ncbi:MAG: hypothetical protein ACK50E_00065, partial [Bacteroidota bacterium]